MVRIIFNPELEMHLDEKLVAAVEKFKKKGFLAKPVVHKDKSVTFVIYTDMQAYDFQTIQMPKAESFAICTGCQSIHFKTPETVNDMFRCPCGNYVNKPKLR